MKKSDTKAIVRVLGRSYLKACDLEFELRLHDEDDAADEARKRATELARELGELRTLSWKEWRGNARRVLDDISAVNSRLQRALRDIERDIRRAERVVKALGYLDKVIEKVAAIRG